MGGKGLRDIAATAHPPQADPSAAIKAEAAHLGFALCGITSASPPGHHDRYRKWLSDGHAGEMAYLERQEPKRADLDAVFPGARALICVALNYSHENGRPRDAANCTDAANCGDAAVGTVARYARFDDYHETMWRRLESLLECVKALIPGADGKAYCDTGPITERDLAMRAGLGWIGKHTNLISRQLGNWFFLGEIVLNVDITPDAPETTHCGTCSRCLPACPTGAITAPYVLDARRCISYLTIELKGSIPIELRPAIGSRIYGCDDCLAVCPWNKFARASADLAVQPRQDLEAPDLIEMLQLDDEAFRRKFRNSPIRRAKRRGLLRNVCVALGNIGDSRAVPALRIAAETDPEPLVREHAAWALGQIQSRDKTTL